MRRILVMLVILKIALCTRGFAQSAVSGSVVDNNKKGLPYATVGILNNDSTVKLVTADTAGHFSINVKPGRYKLSCSYIGFTQYMQEVTIASDTSITIDLQPENGKLLSEVTVSAKKPLVERKIDRLVFNVERSIVLTGTNAYEALGKTPGVRATGDNKINIIGKSGVQVMINGRVSQLSGDDLVNYLKSIPSSDISKIEVITNPPAMYDAGGNSGLINLVLKRNRAAGLNGTLQAGYAQAELPSYNIAGSLNYVTGRLSLGTSISAGRSKNISSKISDIYYPQQLWSSDRQSRNRKQPVNVTFALDYGLSKTASAGLRYTTTFDKSYSEETTLTNVYPKTSTNADSTINTSNQIVTKPRSHDVNIYYEKKFDSSGKKMSLSGNYFRYNKYSEQSFKSYTVLNDASISPDSASVFNPSPQFINVYTGQVDFELPGKSINLSFGGKISLIEDNSSTQYFNTLFNQAIIDPTKSDQFQYKETTKSLYVSGNRKFGKLEMQLGLRGELTNTTGTSFTYNQKNKNNYLRVFPTFYLMYPGSDDNTFTMSYGRRIDRPGYALLNPFRLYSSPFYYIAGNPFLQPSYSNNFELRYDFKDLFSSQLYATITENGFDQLRIPDPATNIIAIEQQNFLTMYSYGAIQSFNWKPLSWLETNNMWQLYYNKTRSSNPNTLKEVSGWSNYFTTSNTLTLNKASTFLANVDFWYQAPEVNGVDRVREYYSLDIGLKALLAKKKLALTITGLDILRTNKVTFSSPTNGLDQIYRTYYGSQSIRFSIAYKFGVATKALKEKSSNAEEKSRAN